MSFFILWKLDILMMSQQSAINHISSSVFFFVLYLSQPSTTAHCILQQNIEITPVLLILLYGILLLVLAIFYASSILLGCDFVTSNCSFSIFEDGKITCHILQSKILHLY